MNQTAQVRLATIDDLRAIEDIYNWYIPRSTCTYQEQIEPFERRVKWFQHHLPRYPVTVATRGIEVVGWGSLSDYRERSAYRFTCENSVYVRHDMQRRGIGALLLADLIERARQHNFHTIIAGADAEQTASIAMHKRFGFIECGYQNQVGFKFGRWLDVIFMQLML